MKKILILRLSAMGDVAMLVPVVDTVAREYPDVQVTVVTRTHLTPLFDWMPKNVEVVGIDLKTDYKGLGGLNKLYKELKRRKFDLIADMHDVLRTKYLRNRFRLAGKKCAKIDKGRKEKKQLIGHGMTAAPLKPMVERYEDVINRLDLPIHVNFVRLFDAAKEDLSLVTKVFGEKAEADRWIGVAPFAAHPGKIYPLDKMRALVEKTADPHTRIFLFGAGEKEKAILDEWAQNDHVECVCGKLGGLHNELLLMSMLDTMVAMDSSNMHLASLVGTNVISVWGATHPKAGFLPYGQPMVNFIQRNDLPCRPCSVYGNRPCPFADQPCMDMEINLK